MASAGIDYFPLDVTLDSKWDLIEAEFGLTGFGVVVHLLQEIYGKKGYYIEWTEEVALLFARRMGLGGSVVSEIIEASIRRGMFDKEIFDKYGVLTSRGIQERYFEAVKRRKVLKVEKHILLVDAAHFCPNVNIEEENVYISRENAYIRKQSRVEESRVEESRVKANLSSANAPDKLANTLSSARARFQPPDVEAVRAYCQERGNGIDAQSFCDYYAARGWMAGKSKMRDWRAAVRTWESRNRASGRKAPPGGGNPFLDMLHEEGYDGYGQD